MAKVSTVLDNDEFEVDTGYMYSRKKSVSVGNYSDRKRRLGLWKV